MLLFSSDQELLDYVKEVSSCSLLDVFENDFEILN